jgi:hypothetical protein
VSISYKNYVLCVLPTEIAGCTEEVHVGQKCGKKEKMQVDMWRYEISV